MKLFLPRMASFTIGARAPKGSVSIFETIRELLALMWSSGQWWLIPLVILLLVCAVIIVIGSASGVGPLIYTLF